MKKSFSILLVFLLTICFSCHQEEHVAPAKGNVTFAVSPATKTGGRVSGTVTPAFVLLSVTDSEGKVQENVKLSLFAFGSSYMSENLELPTGPAQLTKFTVLDASNQVVYATPTEGSIMAKFVNDPLPMAFTVTEEGTQVIPQVLAIEQTDTPASFGYASFGFDIVIPTVNLNINLQYPDGGTYDSVYIIFTNPTGEIKKKLTVDNSTHVATGQAAITLGPWKTSISYYHQDPQANYKKMEKMGFVDINILPTATGLNSNITSVSITNDNNSVQTIPIEWGDYYYYYVVFQHKVEGLVRLPKDPANPFVEVAIWNPEKWTDIYIYVDRGFYEVINTNYHILGWGGFEVYNSDQRWIDLNPKGDLVDNTFFNSAILQAGNQTWNAADSYILIAVENAGSSPVVNDESDIYHTWDVTGSASGGRMAAPSSKLTLSNVEIEERKKIFLH